MKLSSYAERYVQLGDELVMTICCGEQHTGVVILRAGDNVTIRTESDVLFTMPIHAVAFLPPDTARPI